MKLYRATYGGWSEGRAGYGTTVVRWFSSRDAAREWAADAQTRGLSEDVPDIYQREVPTTRDALIEFLTREKV